MSKILWKNSDKRKILTKLPGKLLQILKEKKNKRGKFQYNNKFLEFISRLIISHNILSQFLWNVPIDFPLNFFNISHKLVSQFIISHIFFSNFSQSPHNFSSSFISNCFRISSINFTLIFCKISQTLKFYKNFIEFYLFFFCITTKPNFQFFPSISYSLSNIRT